MLSVGSKAPDFSLLDAKRKAVTLADLGDRKLVIAFFPAAFTSVCERELCTFRDSLTALNAIDAGVVGISVDSPFTNGAFAEKNRLNFPLLSDYRREAVRAYEVCVDDFLGMRGYTVADRAVYVLDPARIIRYAWVGPNPGVEPSYAEVQAAVEAIH